VLRINARKALSLYAHALVKRRKGDIAGSEADIATRWPSARLWQTAWRKYGIK
jgi:hypothetical protein